MAHRSLATGIWGRAAAYALRRRPGPGAPPPAAGYRSVTVSTIRNQVKPQSNIKKNQQEAVSVLEKVLLSIEMEKLANVAKQRMVELEAVRCQKKKALKVYGFTLAFLACMTVYEAKMSP